MPEKTPGQILLAKLEEEAAAIHQAMAESGIAAKIAQKTKAAADVVEDIAEDVVEEIVDDSHMLIKKVKEVLPSRETAFKIIKVIAYWEAVKLMLSFVL
tara:strand:+ start:237 stop:533 length:297 start_codon:yes stop_codon:yes gene_type:complete